MSSCEQCAAIVKQIDDRVAAGGRRYSSKYPKCKSCRRNGPCPKCGHPAPHKWEAWGSYLDKDLVCQKCKYVVDIWDC